MAIGCRGSLVSRPYPVFQHTTLKSWVGSGDEANVEVVKLMLRFGELLVKVLSLG